MEPIRLLLLNYEYPPLGGGAGVVTKHLVKEFSEKQIHTTLVTTWFEGLKEEEHAEGLSIYRLKSRRRKTFQSNPVEMISWMKHAIHFFSNRENQYDVCLSNFMLPGGGVAYYLKRKWNLPYVVLSHGHDIPWGFPQQMWFYHALLYPFLWFIATRSAHNVLLTATMKAMADRFTGKAHASKNLVIPNGIERAVLPGKDFNAEMQVIFGGRLVAQKDPYTFLQAVKMVQLAGIRVRWTVVGDGEMREGMAAMVKKEQLAQVNFTGKIPHDELLALFRRAHLFISSSTYEAMSLTTLEALSNGAYVLSTPVSGTTGYVIEDVSGNFFPFGDAEKLAQGILQYYHQKFLNHYELPAERFPEFSHQYDWKSIAELYHILFRNCKMEAGNL